MNNVLRAQKMLQWFESLGVSDICICPGGRNAPFVFALQDNSQFSVTSAFDERAAGFFAFGRAYAQQKPVVVITTSGTAAAELLPSVIESYYSYAPLIVVTADRPQRLRGTGSPQVIDQFQIFGNYVETCQDIDWNQEWAQPLWSQQKPLHINIAFEEPLLDSTLPKWESVAPTPQPLRAPALSVESFVGSCRTLVNDAGVPLLVVGPLHENEVPMVEGLCKTWPGLVYLEAASGLREKKIRDAIQSGEKFISKLLKTQKLSGILRVGGVPTLKLWRELEAAAIPVVSLSSRPFAGLARGQLIVADLFSPVKLSFDLPVPSALKNAILAEDVRLLELQKQLLQKYPQSEPALMMFLSQAISSSEKVYLGNSLPIREWDAFADFNKPHHVKVNRGANGIDGQIVSALGMCERTDSLSIIVGDLTALYDSTGLWFKDSVHNLRLFVVNNNGGRIFERLFKNAAFYNSHSINFAAWAKMWNMKHFKIHSAQAAVISPGVYEVLPDPSQTQGFWDEYDQNYR